MTSPAGLFSPGDLVDGTFCIEGVLGQGGMGTVYAAVDRSRGGARVALKLMAVEGMDERDVRRFEREVQTLARVDRLEGVVRIHKVGAVHGLPYCVMEYVRGEDLGKAMEGGGVDEARLVPILSSVARTLAACHAEGITHRDLKPANVLLPVEGPPKLADFGLARAGAKDRLTKTGELAGTPCYMAPEQAVDSARAVGPAVDIYALGAVLYHGLAGRPPFDGPVLQVLDLVVNAPPRPPSQVREGVSPALEVICLKALAKRPEDRYPSMEALADDLDRFRAGEPVQAPAPARRGRAKLALLAGASLLGVALVGLGVRAVARPGAQAALARFEAFEREHLTPWALGAGGGAPPEAARLEELSARLEEAKEGGGPGRLDHAFERTRAHLRLLADGPVEEPPRTEPTANLVDGLLLSRGGDHQRACERVRLALRRDPPPGARWVWQEVWRRSLAQEGTGGDQAEDCLREAADLPAGEGSLDEVLEAAARRFLGEATRRALSAGDVGALQGRLDRTRSYLEAVLGEEPARAMLERTRREACEASAKEWRALLARSARRDPLQLEEGVKGLKALLGEGAPGEGLSAELAALCDELGGELEAAPPGRRRQAGERLLDVDLALYYRLEWSWEASRPYRTFLSDSMRTGVSAPARRDVLLAVLRHGVLGAGGTFGESELHLFVSGAQGPRVWPEESRAVRFCAFNQALFEGGKEAIEEPHLSRILALGEQALAPCRFEDLALVYLVECQVVVSRKLRVKGKLLRTSIGGPVAPGAPEVVRKLEGLAADLIEGHRRGGTPTGDRYRALTEAYDNRRFVGELLGDPAVRERASTEGVEVFRALVRDLEEAGREDLLLLARRELANWLVNLAHCRRGPARVEMIREALADVERLPKKDDVRLKVVGRLLEALRKRNRYEEAEAILAPYMDWVLEKNGLMAREAVRLSLWSHDLAEAKRRLRLAKLHLSANGDVKQAEKEARAQGIVLDH